MSQQKPMLHFTARDFGCAFFCLETGDFFLQILKPFAYLKGVKYIKTHFIGNTPRKEHILCNDTARLNIYKILPHFIDA